MRMPRETGTASTYSWAAVRLNGWKHLAKEAVKIYLDHLGDVIRLATSKPGSKLIYGFQIGGMIDRLAATVFQGKLHCGFGQALIRCVGFDQQSVQRHMPKCFTLPFFSLMGEI